MTTSSEQFGLTSLVAGLLQTNYTVPATTDADLSSIVLANTNDQGSAHSSNRLDGAGGVVYASGVIYFADTNNNRICKLTPEGNLTVLAGSGAAVSAAGTGIAAGIGGPKGLVSDGTNLFCTTTDNRILKIVISSGVVTILAGASTAGSTDGTGTAAKFDSPDGLALFNTNADLYVADTGNNTIRKIVISSGVVTTLAGSGVAADAAGTGTAATFNAPRGMATDLTNLFVTTADHNVMKIVVSSGVTTILAGASEAGDDDGTGTAASFDTPTGIHYASPNLYVLCEGEACLRQIVASTGVVTTLVSNESAEDEDGIGNDANFQEPISITLGETGTLVIGSALKLRAIDLTDYKVSTIMGASNAGVGFGKVSRGRTVNVDIWHLPSGGSRGDDDLLGSFEIAPGVERTLSELSTVNMSTGDKLQARADGPGVVMRSAGDEIVP